MSRADTRKRQRKPSSVRTHKLIRRPTKIALKEMGMGNVTLGGEQVAVSCLCGRWTSFCKIDKINETFIKHMKEATKEIKHG